MENTIFVIEPRHRLGVLETTDDQWYPQCNGIRNTLFLYAGTYMDGGEKSRHIDVPSFYTLWMGHLAIRCHCTSPIVMGHIPPLGSVLQPIQLPPGQAPLPDKLGLAQAGSAAG